MPRTRSDISSKIKKVPLPEPKISSHVYRATTGELLIVVPEELRGTAMFLIEKYMKYSSFERERERLISFIKGDAEYSKRTMTKQMFMAYFNALNEHVTKLNVSKEVDEFVENIALKYVHCRYLQFTGFIPKKALIALIQEPPQITLPEFGQFVKPAPYINVSFIPTKLASGKIHAPLVAKYFFSLYTAYVKFRFNNLISKFPRLYSLYNQVVSRYKQKGKNERQAAKLGKRDVLRVLIGNAWLVWVYVAYNKGVIQFVDIPKCIIHDVTAMIDPIDTILPERKNQFEYEADIKLNDVTWRWLIDIYQEQERKVAQRLSK